MQEENKVKLVTIDEAAAAARRASRNRIAYGYGARSGNGGTSRFTCATTGGSSAADSGYRSVWS
jgi:hypothetical protein